MELINNTTVAGRVLIAESVDPARRSVLGIAKATFTISDTGVVKLDRKDPMPIYTKDVETRYGILPREDIPRLDPVFEVMVLGSAFGENEKPVPSRRISLQIGHIEKSLMVFGDRHWVRTGDRLTISEPATFTRMVLGWSRAFGGTEIVEIDEESFIDVADPVNPVGRGFNYLPQIEQISEVMKCPAGYPRFNAKRVLPNIEDASKLISNADDAPLPACWAPCSGSSGILLERIKRAQKSAGSAPELQSDAVTLGSPLMLHRAHPDWVIETPLAESSVRLEGMTPGAPLEFKLPSLRTVLDVSVGGKERALELHPGALTLFPDLRKFTIVYRGVLPYRYQPSDKRSASVRLASGWVPAPRSAEQKRRIP